MNNHEQDIKPKEPKKEQSKKGIVTDCERLAVRDSGSKNGNIIATIPTNTEVKINQGISTTEFYGITTNDGISGFCMKSFIKIL